MFNNGRICLWDYLIMYKIDVTLDTPTNKNSSEKSMQTWHSTFEYLTKYISYEELSKIFITKNDYSFEMGNQLSYLQFLK